MKKRVAEDHVPYDRWVKDRFLDVTPGNVIDYDFIKAKIMYLSKQYDIEALGCDPWNATQLLVDLGKEDINVLEVRQNIACMSPSMKYFENVIKSNNFTHENNPLVRWNFGNVNIVSDGNENIKPKKISKKDRIDVIVALIDAFFVAQKLYVPANVYEIRGMRIIGG
jgi:phage terminase large subunit-like protein